MEQLTIFQAIEEAQRTAGPVAIGIMLDGAERITCTPCIERMYEADEIGRPLSEILGLVKMGNRKGYKAGCGKSCWGCGKEL